MNWKEILFTRYFTLRNLFIAGNLLLLGFFIVAVVKDARREWKGYQKTFYSREIERLRKEIAAASGEEEKERLEKALRMYKSQPVKIRQVMVTPLNRFDRCVTCHVGHDTALSPLQQTVYTDHPFAAKENPIHKAHPVETFGCTVCHEGQGLATVSKAAHGPIKHWEDPLRRGALLEASCAKCHTDVWNEKAMPYTASWRRGERLFTELGCIGCHQVHGQGGPISVDLAEETADKPLSRIDFSYTGLPKEERTLANWIRLHFVKDPATLVPGDPDAHFNSEPIAPSGMPFYNLSEEDAQALTAYVLAMGKDHIPSTFMVLSSTPRPQPVLRTAIERGRAVYVKNGCAACHSGDGSGGIRNFNYENDVEPDLRKTMGTFTRDELKEKIEKGVPVVGKKDPKGATPPLYMPGWKDKIHGQELEDLVTYLQSIAEKSEDW